MTDTALDTAPEAASTARLEMLPAWSVPDPRYAWLHVITVFGSLVLLMAAAPWLWFYVSPFTVLVILPLLGASIYKLTIVLHDCSHFSLFAGKELNRKVGTICALLLGSDFETFRKAHWKHHKEYGNADDPQGRDYLGLQTSSRAHMLWHLVRPLFGYNLFKLASFQTASLTEKAPSPALPHAVGERAARASHPLSREGGGGLGWGLLPFAAMAAIQLALAFLATGFGQVWWLFPLYPVAAASFALFYSQTRGFCEHVAPVGHVGEAHVRSHLPNMFDKIFFYTLNFNYHVEHHYYPQIPSCHLPAIAAGLVQSGKTYPQSRSILSTITTRLAQCPK